MTAILWANNKLFVDSRVEQAGEWYDSADKVALLSKRCRLVSVEPSCFGQPYDDDILGFTYTGAKLPAVAMIQSLMKFTSDHLQNPQDQTRFTHHALLGYYNLISFAKMANFENNFTCLLIGTRHNYLVGYGTGSNKFEIEPVRKDTTHALGSGRDAMITMSERKQGRVEPVRLMHYAALVERSCGGMIWQYEVIPSTVRDIGYELALTALYKAPTQLDRDSAPFFMECSVDPKLIRPPSTVPPPSDPPTPKTTKRKRK
jgi:hypothetical protein